MAGSQRFLLKTEKFGGRWLEKVNAAEKFGVDFFQKSVRSKVKKTAKFSKKNAQNRVECAKIGPFFTFFSAVDGRRKVQNGSKTPFFILFCFVAVTFFCRTIFYEKLQAQNLSFLFFLSFHFYLYLCMSKRIRENKTPY